MENFDISPLNSALIRLNEVLTVYQKDKSDSIVRDSLIKRFEFTYAISLKMIKRYFKLTAFTLDIDSMTFNEMVREANSMGLLKSNLEKWTIFREKRNMTSHMYYENIADDVASIVSDFYDEALFLMNKLKDKIR